MWKFVAFVIGDESVELLQLVVTDLNQIVSHQTVCC